jgi:hypothetical protein
VASLVARNTSEFVVAPMVGSGGVCESLESVFRFCVGANVFTLAIRPYINVVCSVRFAKTQSVKGSLASTMTAIVFPSELAAVTDIVGEGGKGYHRNSFGTLCCAGCENWTQPPVSDKLA